MQGQATASAGFPPPLGNQQNGESAVFTSPGTAFAFAPDGSTTSLTTAVFGLTSATFSFNQNVTDPDTTSGTAYADFVASASFNFYTISDMAATCTLCTFDTDSEDTTLKDLGTKQILYDSITGGSTSGNLIIGDEYQFSASASLTTATDPVLNYGPSLNLSSSTTVPENPAPLVPMILGAFAVLRQRMRRLTK